MAYIPPNTTCKLYRDVEVAPGLQTLYFSSEANKIAYFNNKLAFTQADLTYERKRYNRIRIGLPLSDVRSCNYMTFVNASHENVTYYCYIFDPDYINENCTEVSFVIDEWLTNCHNSRMEFEDCVIEREHNNLAEYNAERANPFRNDMPSLVAEEPLSVSKEMELPSATPSCMILDEFEGLNTKYSWCDYGPFGKTDTQVVSTDEERLCYVVLFGGQFETGEQNSILRVIDYLYAAEYNETAAHADQFTLNGEAFQENWLNMPDIFKMFSWFDTPRRLRNGAASPFYIGVLDPVEGPLTGLYDSNTPVTHAGKQSGQYITNIMNWFTLNDAVGTIIGTYTLPKWMFKVTPNFVKVKKPESPKGYLSATFINNYDAVTWKNMLREAGWEYDGTVLYYIGDETYVNENTLTSATKKHNWYYDFNSQTVKPTTGTRGDYTVTDTNDAYFVDSVYNKSLPDCVMGQELLDSHDGYNIFFPMPVADVENYKLKRAPFSYIRAITPDNNVKEYYYEDFYDITNANSVDLTKQSNGVPNSYPAKFRCVSNVNGQPTMSLVPVNYNNMALKPESSGVIGMMTSDLYKLSPNERLDFVKFPQLGFITDGYLDYLSSQYNDANARKSVEAVESYNHELRSKKIGLAERSADMALNLIAAPVNAMGSTGNAAYATGFGIGNSANKSTGIASIIEDTRHTYEADKNYKQRMAEADMRGHFNGEIYDTLYKGTKPGFVGDYYKAGDPFGFAMYQFDNITLGASLGFFLQVVTLKPAYLALYDNFLTNYGYAVNRIGLPHVYEALKGMTGKALKFNSKNFVYVKTSECKVTGLPYECCKMIEDMFNNGIKFINGDPVSR